MSCIFLALLLVISADIHYIRRYIGNDANAMHAATGIMRSAEWEYSQKGDRLQRRHAYSKLTKTATNENGDMH